MSMKIKILDDIESSWPTVERDADGKPTIKSAIVRARAGDVIEVADDHAAHLIKLGKAENVG